ncbi:hypothetical protein NA57DRAFT_47713 [Rhizodiscina lignyota]|uniref:Pep3/Vps18/deep orange domain-containing protein n=1 Tax=Rhizodiscina lignyota TaxID=1504668 RepID=A0A9P4M5L7_9PEZI|nr:hypothetical protein NA57DRAFT_47713 [Rhizodiscina lignyota]
MSFDPSSGYIAGASNIDDQAELQETTLPVFNVERVSLQFNISADFVAAQVANNVLVLALSSGRVLRIDLERPGDVDDIDLPKRPSEIGIIRRMFMDPTASHLLITTTLAETYYLHTQSRTPKPLARLKGVAIESVAWNPAQPTSSTREILIGAGDGNVYEVFIEPVSEGWRREEKYIKHVWRADGPVVGAWVDPVEGAATVARAGQGDVRRVIVATRDKVYCWVGRVDRGGQDGSGGSFGRFFERESAAVYEGRTSGGAPAMLAVSPQSDERPPFALENSNGGAKERAWAWLEGRGVLHGRLLADNEFSSLGSRMFAEAKLMERSKIPHSLAPSGRPKSSQEPAQSMILTQWHIVQLVEGRIVATNRLDDSVVHDQLVLEPGQSALGLVADPTKNTYWLFTTQEIFEIVVTEEDRDVWKIMLKAQRFDDASQFARTSAQKDAVATASGDFLVQKHKYMEAAAVYGRSTKPFEQVALTFIDNGEQDALRKYLETKLANLKKSSAMQRTMVASWLVEIYMSKLNSLDDTITTKAELAEGMNPSESRDQLGVVRRGFQDFATKYKDALDKKTTYEVISSHGREEELLFYATVVNDYNYVLSYWVQRERWQESLNVLKKQTDPEVFYKYSTVLMVHVPVELVDILMRQSNLDSEKLIPALLNYNKLVKVSLRENQAIRYLSYCITQQQSTDPAIHNTLISIYASHPSRDESQLLAYLQAQSYAHEQNYDADFALRLCIQHQRVQSCVHIYSSMGQFAQAVDMALKHDEVELAASVADRPENDQALRKKLWLKVAKKVIGKTEGIRAAIEFLKRCELLRIEDLIPFFPDFVVIDDFKEEICTALEEYSRHIDALKREMDDSARTAAHIKADIRALDSRYAIVEPGEKCFICRLPLLVRQFFVFPCQHAFHGDCLGKQVMEQSGIARSRKIKELQVEVGRGMSAGKKRERAVRELDSLVARECVLCSEGAVRRVDEPFVREGEGKGEWDL